MNFSDIEASLFRHRFENLVTEMGAMLQRSAISTNVKERADFSCALLDERGELVANAPHIPVHLGALGLCVRMVADAIEFRPGDRIITNHPAFGGSHLPDVTVISPIFVERESKPIAFVANRAHHAEIGGISPGSMPPGAKHLAEEGVVIEPQYLFERGESRIDQISDLLGSGPFPSRNVADNLADLNAQVAANRRGEGILSGWISEFGGEVVRAHLENLAVQSQTALNRHLAKSDFTSGTAIEKLDDGWEIAVKIESSESGLSVSFDGTSGVHPGNFNATPAIIRSAVLYVLRLWTGTELPLNEGLLRDVTISIPDNCFLNPAFSDVAEECPAVVGGNVETSQRTVDALIRALGFQASSQGTMNNFIFGNERFGYYETIGGGAGAGPDFAGASGLHTHMTNTAITDPEILEHRYPVRLLEFSICEGSGGNGKFPGGDGLIREVEFLEPLSVSLLTQHRVEAPFGMNGGDPGERGKQVLTREDSEPEELESVAAFLAEPGDVLRIETPGGGGWGEA
ncbi:hydantoinase B/oxoprolinase family protein [Verrucomicrobiales bacterium]|nr:hydantoinase B/oxoprolinase family protein [bacterium]MDB4662706.1 hydantoinase B/oxoprolinase family protein [Verrucomicrobiales bacterium]MDC0259517.1 hydantoinase B/oxoprolinase family protein [Verrucomicrobiales bacterium]